MSITGLFFNGKYCRLESDTVSYLIRRQYVLIRPTVDLQLCMFCMDLLNANYSSIHMSITVKYSKQHQKNNKLILRPFLHVCHGGEPAAEQSAFLDYYVAARR